MSLASTCFTYIVHEIDFRLMKTSQKCHVAVFFVFSHFCVCFYAVHHEFQVQYIKRRPWLFLLYRVSVTAAHVFRRFTSIFIYLSLKSWHLSRTHAYTIQLDTKFLVDKSHVRWLALSTWWILRDRVDRSLFTFSVTWSTPCVEDRDYTLAKIFFDQLETFGANFTPQISFSILQKTGWPPNFLISS